MSLIDFPVLYIPDPIKGRPLFYGKIFVGEPDLDPEDGNGNPINSKQLRIVQEDGTKVDVPQPFILSAGGVPVYNGSTVRLDVDGNYSLKILDKNGAQTYYIHNVNVLVNDLSQAYEFPTVAEMKSSLIPFPDGKPLKTLGYYSAGDGGGADYIKRSGSSPNIGSPDIAGGGYAEINEPSVLAEQWGVSSINNSAINSPILQAAMDTGRYVFVKPGAVYEVANLVTSPGGGALVCVGGRAALVVPAGAGFSALSIRNSDFELKGFNIFGGDQTIDWGHDLTPSGTRIGVVVGNGFGTSAGIHNVSIQDCDISGFDRAGLQGIEVQVGFIFGKRVSYTNVNCYRNFVGFAISERHEYCTFSQCYGWENREGLQMTGGNNSFSVCHFEWNYINASLQTGENDAHGTFVGCGFNHSDTFTAGSLGLLCRIGNGQIFTGCNFWFADIRLEDCTGVSITDCQIVGSAVEVIDGGMNNIDRNYTRDPLVPTLTGTTFTTFRQNRIGDMTNQTQQMVYGDYFVESKASTSAFPISWVAGSSTVFPYANLVRKYNSTDFPLLHNGNVGVIPYSNNYQFNVNFVFENSATGSVVLELRIYKNGSVTPTDTYVDSGSFDAGFNLSSLKISETLFLTENDSYDVSLWSTGGTTVTIQDGDLSLLVKSLDN